MASTQEGGLANRLDMRAVSLFHLILREKEGKILLKHVYFDYIPLITIKHFFPLFKTNYQKRNNYE